MTRRFTPASYPGKKRLTEAEQNEELRSGPPPEWLEPWVKRGVMLADLTKHGYGYIHVYSIAGSFQYDFASWPTEEAFRWGLLSLWEHHLGRTPAVDRTYPKCEECEGVVYFAPDQSARVRVVIELDEEEPEAGE
ncbi:hypothetical protein A4X17_05280 [Plantibacter sp. H53]|uniref:hypothetical protein n=1 Tax=Plantibacter sp. H53 TaxID=1827323 RepID=UPI0007D9343A|nr:hypothetical protein [Plantibacter sp. H53]OAN29000.1 hypothetical protein A4X17_05280 [Plantibacter sp. H53]